MYQVIELKWVITGDQNYVLNTNKNIIKNKNIEMNGLNRTIHNYLEFYQS